VAALLELIKQKKEIIAEIKLKIKNILAQISECLKNKDEEEKAKEEEKWNLKRLKEELKDKEELEKKNFGGAPQVYETVYDIQKIEKLLKEWQVISVERIEKKIDEASYKRNVSRPWRNKFQTHLHVKIDLHEINWDW